ncbi:pickpocket protein 28-like [Periplaneta americana]|uniref:pickpocket protein 28-like n=1 Tax=Periplaneta americana TaxID=6978 RepID=UPI0037E89765
MGHSTYKKYHFLRRDATRKKHSLHTNFDPHVCFCGRIFWAAAFILALATAAFFITHLYRKWDDSPVIVSIGARATQLIAIPFPAVTVCTMNKVRKAAAEQILNSRNPDDDLNKILLKDMCDDTFEAYDSSSGSSNDIVMTEYMQNRSGKWDTIQSFMTNVSQPCYEMIQSCYYAGQNQNCIEIFNPALTDEGICCSFNKLKRDLIFRNPRDLSDLNVTFPRDAANWTPEGGYPPNTPTGTLPWRPRGAGSHLGLTLILDANIDDYYCSSTSSIGFKVRLHNPVETPKVSEFGLLLTPGQEYRMVIRPTITNASSSIRKIPENKRLCVFSDEKYLKYYNTYTQRNCALECEANYTLSICKCVPYYLPKDANTTICAKKDENCTMVARKAIEMRLVDESANTSNLGTENEGWTKPECQCLPGCSELSYRGTISSAKVFGHNNFKKGYGTKNSIYFRKNMAVVHLFFTESQFMNYYKTELFGFTEFLSNTGGLLGLFLGFSFLSAVEVFYFISMRLWFAMAQRRQQRQTSLILANSSHVNMVSPYPFAQ